MYKVVNVLMLLFPCIRYLLFQCVNVSVSVEDYDVDVRNIRNGVVDIRNNVVVKCCK